jgi:DNA-binding LytR/AlgR family response regulator
MEVEIKIDDAYVVPKIVIHTNRITAQITDLVKKLSIDTPEMLVAYQNDEVFLINPADILNIYTEGQKIFARLANGTYRLKNRLYELEELFEGTAFLRISNSEIVNFNNVESLNMSISGTISLKLRTGGNSFVSRRYVDKIKKYLGL